MLFFPFSCDPDSPCPCASPCSFASPCFIDIGVVVAITGDDVTDTGVLFPVLLSDRREENACGCNMEKRKCSCISWIW